MAFSEGLRGAFMLDGISLFVAIVAAALCDKNTAIFNMIDQAIFLVDAAAEFALQVTS